MFYLTTYSTHFIYGYIASDILYKFTHWKADVFYINLHTEKQMYFIQI